jgi:tetratricopeptide (TPR) repeat protein
MKTLLAIFFMVSMNFAYADASPPAKLDPPWLVDVRASVKSNKYEQAIQQLQSANQTTSAEWNNLMGYSLRQQKTPDLVGAENYYQAALKIDPKHKGALEYYGMLKLIQNDLSGAEDLLIKLDKICFFGCEEYTDLKNAISVYKSKKK